MTDEFIRRAIKILADSLSEKDREACRARAKAEHMTLQQQLDMLTTASMAHYREPDLLKPYPNEPEKVGIRQAVRDGKMAAAGDLNGT